MDINYFEPLSKGWRRMKDILFNPFDMSKWFMLGFTAFLAGLLDGPGGGSGGNKFDNYRDKPDFDDIADFPAIAWDWLMEHSLWFGLILFGIFFITALLIVFNWLSSRGKFMFLDNVVHNRAEVTKPWYDFKTIGNSLFVWRLIYGFICLAVFLLLFGLFFSMFLGIYATGFPRPATAMTIFGMSMIFLTVMIIIGYITLFMNDFVVPIMYKYQLSATQAWGKFLKLFGTHFWHFILYGLFIFVLMIFVVVLVISFVLMTCCVGGILLIIPYLGSVLFLPVSVTFRALSVEYLEQFDDKFKIFPVQNDESLLAN
ncbi:MAG: hypothetical protein QNK30_13500 [Bacteroidales bacterium]|nr:hypothetical protein [Bacteroidales bacterium]